MILYQFKISHYCEKVRWALDYKALSYEVKNLLPGFHFFQTRKIAPASSVPILVSGHDVVQGSSAIIDFLDEKYPANPLTPNNPKLAAEAMQWEKYLDEKLGENLRRIYYFYTLDNRQLATSSLLQGSKPYLRPIFLAIFPILKKVMRKSMQIYPKQTKKSEIALFTAFDRLEGILSKQPFILGDRFSRVDLTASALLGLLCKPQNKHTDSPRQLSQPFMTFCENLQDRPLTKWVSNIYQQYRLPNRS